MLGLALGGAVAAAPGDDFPGVRGLMDEAQFREAGLHKLTPAERQVLDAWLLDFTAGEAASLRQTSETVKEAEQAVRIEATLIGPFKGWFGDTVFRLDNGQLWRQRLDGMFAYNGDGREVVIDRNLFGFWRLTHVATGRRVGVSRVR